MELKDSPPKLYEDILYLHGGLVEAGTPAARVGGDFWFPDLARAYLLAARDVIAAGLRERRLNEVALPISYLQRHALELAIKALIGACAAIREYESTEEEVDAPAPDYVHGLSLLLDRAKRDLEQVGYENCLPTELFAIAAELEEREGKNHARWRYLHVRKGPKLPEERSFPEELTLPVVDLQYRLESVFEKHLRFRPNERGRNLATALTEEVAAAFEEYHR